MLILIVRRFNWDWFKAGKFELSTLLIWNKAILLYLSSLLYRTFFYSQIAKIPNTLFGEAHNIEYPICHGPPAKSNNGKPKTKPLNKKIVTNVMSMILSVKSFSNWTPPDPSVLFVVDSINVHDRHYRADFTRSAEEPPKHRQRHFFAFRPSNIQIQCIYVGRTFE